MEFKIPELGENIEFGTVVSVFVKPGDIVNKDDPLFELETEKAVLEVPAPSSGKINKVLLEIGQDVKPGQYVVEYEPSEKTPEPVKETAEKSVLPPASPTVRREAQKLGIDLHTVQGSGPSGRILNEDLGNYDASIPKPLEERSVVRMSNLRKTIAKNIEYSSSHIPHVTQHDEADITNMEEVRKKLSKEIKITPTAMILKVLAKALLRFPEFNAGIDMEKGEIIYFTSINIGFAADTPDGLLVPVIQNSDQKNLLQLASELAEKSEKARNRKLAPEEMKGGTFTLTNLGSIGGSFFTPIIRPGEVAILGTGRSSIQPRFQENTFLPRLILPLSLSYDHRLIDGAKAARFLRWIADALENPWNMEAP